MAFTQKNNPFKQRVPTDEQSSTNNMDLAKRLNKMRFEMGHIYPITEKDRGKYVGQTAQTEQERIELYNIDPTGRGDVRRDSVFGELESGEWGQIGTKQREVPEQEKYAQDLSFIKTAKEAGPEVFDKLMSLPKKSLIKFQDEVIKVAKPFVGKKIGGIKNSVKLLEQVEEMDLSGFKTYLDEADISKGDIREIVVSQLNNLPDKNKDGTPDVFEGIKGKIIREGINRVMDAKLNSLD